MAETSSDFGPDLEQSGYVTAQLLTQKEAEALQDKLGALRDPQSSQVYISSFTEPDDTYRFEVFREVRKAIAPCLSTLLPGMEIQFASFNLKKPGGGEVPLHQDLTIAENPGVPSINIWCPLMDAVHASGALCVVEGSHRLVHHVSALGSRGYWGRISEELKERSVPLSLQAGEAIIYDSRLLHWSPPNLSSQPRPAIIAGCLPIGERPVFFREHNAAGVRQFETFDMSDEGYFRHSYKELQTGNLRALSLGFIENKNTVLSSLDLQRLAGQPRSPAVDRVES